MKKYLLLVISFIAFLAIAEVKANIFCEEATTTTCKACPAVSEIIYEIYKSHEYPFYFVSLVADKSNVADERTDEYNVYGYPTVFFDGGYRVVFGKQNKQDYINAIEQCLQRDRANIEAIMNTKWNGNGIDVDLTLKSKENDAYEGYLKIYVVEPVSRWNDYEGKPYHFALIGYAINEEIYIEAGKEIKKHVIWNASKEDYVVSNDNIMAIAVVFNVASNTGYSDPPYNNHPFTAYYVDVCVASSPPVDEPPILQFIEKPSSIEGFRNVSFKWKGEDDFGDVLFSYKLVGYEEWHEWGNETTAFYYNLQDGEYEFILRGKDNIGQISQIKWKFVVDTSPPTIVGTSPKDGARNVPIYEPIVIKFSHEMNKKSVKISIYPKVDYTLQWKNGNEIVIYPSLEYETLYTVTIKNATRIGGQKMQKFSFSFETASADVEAPSILYVKPFLSELYGDIKIKFSEPMDTILHNSIIIKPWIPFSYKWEENDTLLLITLRHYLPGNYTVEITKFMEDKSGNPIKSNYSFSFYITLPHITYTSIKNGEENVLPNTEIRIKFSHGMDKNSVEKNLSIHPKCNYSISWEGNVLIISPQLKWGKKYFINISRDAKDNRSIPLNENFSIWFTTEKEVEREGKEEQMPSFTFLLFIISIIIFLLRKKSK
ncbi:MAG: hypothetical protein FE041_00260 [Thermoplasmata archaeon]|nr:MAG: hypothetical protein FE041_00260 [Thermoplasmata archaeon]